MLRTSDAHKKNESSGKIGDFFFGKVHLGPQFIYHCLVSHIKNYG
jgi:hypothetical protein